MNAIYLNAHRSAYAPEDCEKTMTVNDLIEYLEYIRDSEDAGECPIYLKHDRGYTYGEITEYSFEIPEYSSEEE